MRDLKAISLLLLPLLGCYAQIENPDVSVSHNLCGGTTACMPAALPLSLIQISGQNTFTLDFGNQPLFSPSTSLGPSTLNDSLVALGAGVQLQAAAGNDFKNVATISLLSAPTASTDCRTTGSNCTVLADFDSTRDGQADQSLVLKGKGVDLLTLISATHTLNLQLQASGTGPTNPWNATVSMDMSLTARASLP